MLTKLHSAETNNRRAMLTCKCTPSPTPNWLLWPGRQDSRTHHCNCLPALVQLSHNTSLSSHSCRHHHRSEQMGPHSSCAACHTLLQCLTSLPFLKVTTLPHTFAPTSLHLLYGMSLRNSAPMNGSKEILLCTFHMPFIRSMHETMPFSC